MTLIIFYLFLIFNLFSKFLLTDICLPFTFDFTIFSLLFFSELLFTFYFLELLYFFSFSFTYVLFLVSTRTSNPPPLPPLLVRLFSVCAVVPIFITLLGCDRISGHVPQLFILLIFSYFSLWILYIAGARETQEDTL